MGLRFVPFPALSSSGDEVFGERGHCNLWPVLPWLKRKKQTKSRSSWKGLIPPRAEGKPAGQLGFAVSFSCWAARGAAQPPPRSSRVRADHLSVCPSVPPGGLGLRISVLTVQLSHPYLTTGKTIAYNASLFMEFLRQEYWSGLPFPSPGDLPDPGIEPVSPVPPALQEGSLPAEPLGKPLYLD